MGEEATPKSEILPCKTRNSLRRQQRRRSYYRILNCFYSTWISGRVIIALVESGALIDIILYSLIVHIHNVQLNVRGYSISWFYSPFYCPMYSRLIAVLQTQLHTTWLCDGLMYVCQTSVSKSTKLRWSFSFIMLLSLSAVFLNDNMYSEDCTLNMKQDSLTNFIFRLMQNRF